MEKTKAVIITGLSGAGKTSAADWFEDMGYYCVDNMPPGLIKPFIELSRCSNKKINELAFVVDIRSRDFFEDINTFLDQIKSLGDIDCKILFIEASDETLIKRFSETRRNHPLTTGNVTRAVIAEEREQLSDLRNRADYIIDTTSIKVADFRNEMKRIFVRDAEEASFVINVTSFGFKHGIPLEADVVFDVRFIPNPYYVKSLKNLTGNNKKVSNYVLRQPIAQEYLEDMAAAVDKLAPYYMKEGKQHLNLCVGCTGGQHRSVAMANRFAEIFRERGYRVTLIHREL